MSKPTLTLSGPMFEQPVSAFFTSVINREGAHCNIYRISNGMKSVRAVFGDYGEHVDEENFCLFSTSGVHGSYTTLEELEASLRKYGHKDMHGSAAETGDWHGDTITILIIQPRIVCLRYGDIRVELKDIPYLKKLRELSTEAMAGIGWPSARNPTGSA